MARIWAVARNTIAQALRMRVAAIFMVLLFILLPLMWIIVTGDGTLKGKLQTFVNYGLSLTSLLLCLLTVIISTFTLTSELKGKQIWTVLTKPVRRYEVLLGKLLGIIVLDAILLAGFATIIYGLTVLMPAISRASDDERVIAQNEFFTARASIKPQAPDVSREVDEAYKHMVEQHQLPEDMTEQAVRAKLREQFVIQQQAVPLGTEKVWQFYNVDVAEPNEFIFIKFKYDVAVNPPDLCVYGRWAVGDDRQLGTGAQPKTPIYVADRKDSIRTVHEMAVPASAVSDGYLGVAFQNPAINNTLVTFNVDEGIEVLYKAGTFAGNYFRAVLLIFIRLIFLAMLGVSLSTWLSFPVAILVGLVAFVLASLSGFIIESFTALQNGGVAMVYMITLKPVIQMLSQYDANGAATYMTKAQLIAWSTLGWEFLLTVCIQGMLVWLIGVLIFHRKEIAKVTV
jgi:hypothetical protein